jgi:hypothetical protein
MSPYLKTSLAVLAIAAPLAAAGLPIRAPEDRRPEGMPSANRGQSAAMIFNTPGIAVPMAGFPGWARPEFARNDRGLGYRPPVALTAINEWPQPLPPSIDDARRFTLGRSPYQVIFFESRGVGYGHRGIGRRGHHGGRHLHTPLPR